MNSCFINNIIFFYDDLSFSNTESNHISVICSDNSIKEENNIVYKTAIHMQKINNGGGDFTDILFIYLFLKELLLLHKNYY